MFFKYASFDMNWNNSFVLVDILAFDKASEKLNIKNFHVGGGSATMMKLIVVIVNALIPSLVFVPCARRMRCLP